MQQFLINISTHHVAWIYVSIVVLAFIEGPVVSMILGVLIKLNYFSFIPVYIALMVGDMLGDSFWYFIGRRYGFKFINKFGKYFSITEEKIKKTREIFHAFKYRILIISKITNGFGLSMLVLLTAGISHIPFVRYISTNFIGQVIWTGMLISVGYFFSHAYLEINGALGKISVISLFIILILAFFGFIKYIKNKSLPS